MEILFLIIGVIIGMVLTMLFAPNFLQKNTNNLNTVYENISTHSGTTISKVSGSGNVVATSLRGKSSIMIDGLKIEVDNNGKVFINDIPSTTKKLTQTEEEKVIAKRTEEAQQTLDELELTITKMQSEKEYIKQDLESHIELYKLERAEFNSEISTYIEALTLEVEYSLNQTISSINHIKDQLKDRLK